jgi:hypothetical protein
LAQVVEHRAGPFEQGAECRFAPWIKERDVSLMRPAQSGSQRQSFGTR